MSATPAVLQVVILRDGLLVGTEVFIPGSYVLGSGPEADLKLEDPGIEAQHAVVYFQNGRAAIQDNGSSQGIYVNGHRVTECEIRSVDELLVGPFVLKTRVLSQRPPAARPSGPMEAILRPAAPPAAPAPMARPPPAPVPLGGDDPIPPTVAARGLPNPAPIQVGRPTGPLRPAMPVVPPGVSLGSPTTAQDGTSPSTRRLQAVPRPAAPPAGPVAATRPAHLRPVAALNPAEAPADPSDRPTAETHAVGALLPVMIDESATELYMLPEPTAPQPRPPPAQARPPSASPAPAGARPPGPGPAQPVPQARPVPPGAQPPFPVRPALAQPAAAGPTSAAAQKTPQLAAPPGRPAPHAPAPVQARPHAGHSAPATGHRGAHGTAKAPWPTLPARPNVPSMGLEGKGEPQLYLELYWGSVRREARCFGPKAKEIHGAAAETAPMPLWGFELPEKFVLAEPSGQTYRIFAPPGSQLERGTPARTFAAAASEGRGGQPFLTLSSGMAARFSVGAMSVVAYVAPPAERVKVSPFAGLPWLNIGLFLVLLAGFIAFLLFGPRQPELADFNAKNLAPVAIKLIAPEPKKKEEAQKKLQQIKAKADPAVVADSGKPAAKKSVPKAVQAAPESKALKALAKISAAGPAAGDILAAVDKLGSGPGVKGLKNSNLKLAGLVGTGPVASAGLGTFGLGGGGKGGGSTLGMETLRGGGAGGIGAMGAGSVGRGAVGGTVARASTRSIGVAGGRGGGSIDREAVAKVVNAHIHEVSTCYELALLRDPGLSGKLVLEWVISTDGRVVTAKPKSSTMRNADMVQCALGKLKSWKFPPAKGGEVIVSYPFIFNSVGY